MLLKLVDGFESLALRTAPAQAVRLLGAVPASVLAALQRSRFRRTLRLAAERSPFYREQFRRRGIDVRGIDHPSELGDFYTTGEDLRRAGGEAFLTARPETVFETTGTTSAVPKRVFFSTRELNESGCASSVALRVLGLRKDDVVASAFDCSFWVSPAVLRSALQYVGCFHVEAGKIPPEEFYERAKHYRPTVIFGEPSWLVRLAEVVRERGGWPLKFMLAGGENLTEPARQAVEDVWHAPLYLNYGQTEAFGALGIECQTKQGYHRDDMHFIFEICGGREGELVYTTLTRHVMPLIRYRSSDVTRLVNDPCPCGVRINRIAKIRSRVDEMVVCGMGNVGPWVFEQLLEDVPASDWQVVVTNDDHRDMVELTVEVEDLSSRFRIEDAVRLALRERFPDFSRNLAMKLYDLRVATALRGTLRNGRKIRRVIDDRRMVAAST